MQKPTLNNFYSNIPYRQKQEKKFLLYNSKNIFGQSSYFEKKEMNKIVFYANLMIDSIFPKENFSVKGYSKISFSGNTRSYKVYISNKGNLHSCFCILQFQSSGSTHQDSDLDITLHVKNAEVVDLSKARLHSRNKKLYGEKNIIIAANLVQQFNLIKTTYKNKVFEHNRSIHVYFTEPEQRIFDKEIYYSIAAEYKNQEMAACLISLRISINKLKWEKFTKKVLNDIQMSCCNSFKNKAIDQLNRVFSLTEIFYSNFNIKLKTKIHSMKKQKLPDKSLRPIKFEEIEKIACDALDNLYIEQLIQLACIKKSINQVKKAMAHTACPLTSKNNISPKFSENLALLILAQDRCRIYANMFADEAYIGYPAIYHVVDIMQKKINKTLSERTILGSSLHQIGFKLFQLQKTINVAKSTDFNPKYVYFMTRYQTAKYGFRLAHGLTNGLNDASFVANHRTDLLTSKEINLLLADIAIIKHIKNNPSWSLQEKCQETKRFLTQCYPNQIIENRLQFKEQLKKESKQWLLIAAKLIVASYSNNFQL